MLLFKILPWLLTVKVFHICSFSRQNSYNLAWLFISWEQLLPPMTCSQLIKVLLTLPLALVNFSWHHQALSPDATNQRSSLTPALKPAGQPQPMLPKSKLQAFGPMSFWLSCQVSKSKACQLEPQPITYLFILPQRTHIFSCLYFCSCHSHFWACPV